MRAPDERQRPRDSAWIVLVVMIALAVLAFGGLAASLLTIHDEERGRNSGVANERG
jgi:hypothetical protein